MDAIERALELLGLGPEATPEDVKQAYRDLVKVWHPDRFPNDPRLRSKAEEKLKDINESYQTLHGYSPRSRPRTSREAATGSQALHDHGKTQAQKQGEPSAQSKPLQQQGAPRPAVWIGIREQWWAYAFTIWIGFNIIKFWIKPGVGLSAGIIVTLISVSVLFLMWKGTKD